ncbi:MULTISPECIES: hypothetical protein [Cupriavidus]
MATDLAADFIPVPAAADTPQYVRCAKNKIPARANKMALKPR